MRFISTDAGRGSDERGPFALVTGAGTGIGRAATLALLTDVISPVSAWEVGMLGNPRGGRPALRFLPDPRE